MKVHKQNKIKKIYINYFLIHFLREFPRIKSTQIKQGLLTPLPPRKHSSNHFTTGAKKFTFSTKSKTSIPPPPLPSPPLLFSSCYSFAIYQRRKNKETFANKSQDEAPNPLSLEGVRGGGQRIDP